ncbi:MAG: CorA family divalent cation transporter [Firmicutes bacterium]|nr:CorA family divalent cation transporter [Bacillota bacterium]
MAKWRSELLRLKRYYEQLDAIFDEMSANDNALFSRKILKRLSILGNRTDRYLRTVLALQDIVNQMCDLYQSQLSIQQNDLMKIFTIITSLFLPLTLITGWYGMNFRSMPELEWKYGYLCVIAVCAIIVIILTAYFKRKKWI